MASFCSKEISGMHCASRGLSLLFRIEKTEYLPVLKTSTKFESALQQLATGNCTNALRELLQFHWQCFGNATAQDCYIYKIYTRLFSGRFVIGQIDTGKLWICPYTWLHCVLLHCVVNHMSTGRCPVALLTFKYTAHIVIQEVMLCNYLYTRNA